MMSVVELVGFLLLTGAAAYIQTVTGFAFGLITMGGVGLTGVIPLPDAAVIVSVLTLTNGLQMLLKGWREVAWAELRIVVVSSAPFLFAGFVLLQVLEAERLDILRLILGLVIVGSSIQLARTPHPREDPSSAISFAAFGAIAGLMGGLFSTSGPPLVYHFHRQPMAAARIRETLVTVFAMNAVLRLGIVAFAGAIPTLSTWWALLAIPVVFSATFAARRWQPPLSPTVTRKIVLLLLFLSGVSLAVPAVVHLRG